MSSDEQLSQSIFKNFLKNRNIMSDQNTPPVDTNCFQPFDVDISTQDLTYRNFQKIMPGNFSIIWFLNNSKIIQITFL